MSVTGSFFSKLRSLALTLEKEAAHLEQVFNQEDDDCEEESPMRVLQDLRSEIISTKSDIQASLDKNEKKGQELNAFIKICKVLQQRNASDLQQIKDTFQKYGYTPPDGETAETNGPDEVAAPESAEGSSQSSDPQDLPPPPVIEKPATWDLLRAPQLSDFGLSHYQLPVVWKPQSINAPEEKPKPLYKDTCSVNVAKTPKCALRTEDDFSAIQHFGISDYSANLNDDYTMALKHKTKGSDPKKPKDSSKDCNNPPKTPAHLIYRNDFVSVDSPLPPVFCTPGLKVHKKLGRDVMDQECDANGTDDTSSTKDTTIQCPIDAYLPRSRSADALDSPRPPDFCTPGLKVQKTDISSVHPQPSDTEEPSRVKSLDAPPLPSFKTQWLNGGTVRSLDLTEPIPRPELSQSVYLTEAAPLALNSDGYYENPKKTTSPPNRRDFCIVSPSRPEMTSCLTEDLFKHDLKLTSPPKVSEYGNMLQTPTRPEMTTSIAEDLSQMLSQYCMKQTQPSWQNAFTNKENRP